MCVLCMGVGQQQMLCSLFWFIYYKLVFVRILFKVQTPFIHGSWFTKKNSPNDFDVFMIVFIQNSFGSETQIKFEGCKKNIKSVFKKNTRGRPLVWYKGPFLLFFIFYFFPLSFSPFLSFFWYLAGTIVVMAARATTNAIIKSQNFGLLSCQHTFDKGGGGGGLWTPYLVIIIVIVI